jgi:hypothetical protein
MIEHRREVGAWLTLDRRLYALPSHPYTWRRQAKAAELSVEGAGLSHRAGAVLHGVGGFRPGGLDLTVPRSANRTSGLATVHRSEHFDVVRQAPFPWWPLARQRVDALIPRWKLIVERAA